MNAHERAAEFIAELRGQPEEEAINPDAERRSIDRVTAAQRRALAAMEELATIVAEADGLDQENTRGHYSTYRSRVAETLRETVYFVRPDLRPIENVEETE